MMTRVAPRLITGPARSGKTTALQQLAQDARASGERVVQSDAPDALVGVAFEVLESAAIVTREIDDIDAAALLDHAARPLLELEWPELLDASIDPEVGGMRSPSRFLASAYRLFRKLREAAIGPEEFLSRSLTGATNFYAKPPNFSHPELIYATKDAYRDSLDVTAAELQRQREREIDLAKILARLYRCYVDAMRAAGVATGRDAIAAAIDLLESNEALLRRERGARRFFIDEAQELSAAEVRLLRLLCGDDLDGLVVAGAESAALRTHAASAGSTLFKALADRVVLTHAYDVAPAAANAAAQISAATQLPFAQCAFGVTLERFADEQAEMSGIVRRVRAWLSEGVAPERIAVLFRTVCDVGSYERALLDADVPVVTSGDVNIFDDPRSLDAIALLWNYYDPFAHAWMLRTLEGPTLALSDASLVTLCSEPADPQASLFTDDAERSPTERPSRWDPKRDVRLGWNVVRGDLDYALSTEARERVQWFRNTRSAWIAELAFAPIHETIARIWNDALPRDGAPGSARERSQRIVLDRLLERFRAFSHAHPQASLGDALRYAEDRRSSEFESCEDDRAGGVHLLSIGASRGRSFDRVALPDVRAGSFPRWYAPDTFLFSPSLGMIPKENAGGARAARTAKFTYYVARVKAREAFNDGERRALAYALSRASGDVYVTVSGKPTRGITAPEFFEELQRAKLPGVRA